MHDSHPDNLDHDQVTVQTTPAPGGASCTGSNAPGVPAPGVAGEARRQGAPDWQAATGGGAQPGGDRRAEPLSPKRQRPRQPKLFKRLHQPSCRMNDAEFARFATAAAHCKMTNAAFLAYAVDKAARDLTRTAAAIATEREVINELFAAPSPPGPYRTACSTRSPRPSTPAPTHPTSTPPLRPSATRPAHGGRRRCPARPPRRQGSDVIPSIHKRGSETVGLIRYLYGPGTKEEHIDPHLVAAFDR